MNRSQYYLSLGLIPLTAMVAVKGEAVQYLTVEQAQKVLFPTAARFVPTPVKLTEAQVEQIEDISDTNVRQPSQPVWQAVAADGKLLGHFIVDEVYGKHEFITYAVAIDANGAVAGIEVMDYRETYGGEIRHADWRAQFIGKKAGDTLKLKKTIENISGATLSCKHVTEGVRRLLTLHKLVLAR